MNFRPNKSFPNNRTIKLIGVNITKNTNAITIGAMIVPSNSPSLIQALFSGVKSFEFNNPRIRKGRESIKKIRLISFPFNTGQKPIMQKTIKNNIPKLLLFSFFNH